MAWHVRYLCQVLDVYAECWGRDRCECPLALRLLVELMEGEHRYHHRLQHNLHHQCHRRLPSHYHGRRKPRREINKRMKVCRVMTSPGKLCRGNLGREIFEILIISTLSDKMIQKVTHWAILDSGQETMVAWRRKFIFRANFRWHLISRAKGQHIFVQLHFDCCEGVRGGLGVHMHPKSWHCQNWVESWANWGENAENLNAVHASCGAGVNY